MTGKKQSIEQRAAQSARQTGAGNPLFGHFHSDKSKALGRRDKIVTGITTTYISIRKASCATHITRDTIKKYSNKPYRGYIVTVNAKEKF